jgi:polysaccharide deacetylase family protein (PEP-CTERM system associated)
MIHSLSFDIENWFQGFVQRGIRGWEGSRHTDEPAIAKLLDVLDEAEVKATFFVVGDFAQPDLLKKIAERNHEIASHSYDHRAISEHSPTSFREDLRKSISVLQDITGERVVGYRAPRWSLQRKDFWVLDIMCEEQLVYDSSVYPTNLHPFGDRKAPLGPYRLFSGSGQSIFEVPAQVLTFGPIRVPVAGGFYFRALPLSFSKRALRQSEENGSSGMVYLHPYDFDDKVPRLKAGPSFRIIRYHNLGKTEGYLRRLLKEFRFAPIREILDSRKGITNP